MFPTPARPEFADGHAITSTQWFRYEDVTMDARLIPLAAPAGLAGLWRDLLVQDANHRATLERGVIPILTRLTVHTTDNQIRVDRPAECHNGYQLARGDDRLYMNVWCELRGTAGRLGKSTTGEQVIAGTVFAEHTYTRPLAPRDQRKVTELANGLVPSTAYAAPPPASAGEAPDGATYLDELAPDAADYVFTLDQSDSNQHVNSLVYVRLFIEAVNRRLVDRGKPLRTRATAFDVAYRKPCFPGDRVRAQLRLYQNGEGDGLGAAGQIVGSDGKVRCFVRIALG
jgi:hypothetical protein